MATSGQLNTNTTYDSYFWVKWSQNGNQDIPNNRTSISWSCGVYCGHSFYSNAIKMSAVTINGTKVYGGGTYSDYSKGNHTIASGTMWINHNSDGKKTFSISSFTGWLYSSHNYSSNGGSYALTTIPRQATITSAPDFTDLQNPVINYSNPAGTAVDSLMACISFTGATDDIKYRDNISKTGTSYTFSLTDAERNLLRNNTPNGSRNVIFFVRTIIGGVTYHSTCSKKFTVVETDDTRPAVTMTVALNNGSLPSKFENMCIQGKSKYDVNISAEGKYGATITDIYAVIDGKTYNSVPFTSDVFQRSGEVYIDGYAKDSRGFTKLYRKPIGVVPYSKPLVVPVGSDNAILCYRSDGNGIRVGNSTSVWIKAQRSYSIQGMNQCALQWRKKLTTEQWVNDDLGWNTLIDNTNTSTDVYNALISGEVFDLKKSYTIQIRAIDEIGEKDVKTFEIPTQDVALHLGRGGKNVSVGTYCDYSQDYTFYSDWVGIFDKGLFGSSLNFNVTDVLKFPEECTDGITPIIINSSTNKDNLPSGDYAYSVGIVHKRAADQYNVILMDYVSGKIAINVHLSGTWTGWKYIIPQ